jgi:hypothetical protein
MRLEAKFIVCPFQLTASELATLALGHLICGEFRKVTLELKEGKNIITLKRLKRPITVSTMD